MDITNDVDTERKISVLKKAVVSITRTKNELEDALRDANALNANLKTEVFTLQRSLQLSRQELDEVKGKLAVAQGQNQGRGATGPYTSSNGHGHLMNATGAIVQGAWSGIKGWIPSGGSHAAGTPPPAGTSTTPKVTPTAQSSGGGSAPPPCDVEEMIVGENERLHEKLFELKQSYEAQLSDLKRENLALRQRTAELETTSSEEAKQLQHEVDAYKKDVLRSRHEQEQRTRLYDHALGLLARKVHFDDAKVTGARDLAVHCVDPVLVRRMCDLCGTLHGHLSKLLHALESYLVNTTERLRAHGLDSPTTRSAKDRVRSLKDSLSAAGKDLLEQLADAGREMGCVSSATTGSFELQISPLTGSRCVGLVQDALAVCIDVLGLDVSLPAVDALVRLMKDWHSWVSSMASGATQQQPQRTTLTELLAATVPAFLSFQLCVKTTLLGTSSSSPNSSSGPSYRVINERLVQCGATMVSCLQKTSSTWSELDAAVASHVGGGGASSGAYNGAGRVVGMLSYGSRESFSIEDGADTVSVPPVYVDPRRVHDRLRSRCVDFLRRGRGVEGGAASSTWSSTSTTLNHRELHIFRAEASDDDRQQSKQPEQDTTAGQQQRRQLVSALHAADDKAVEFYLEWQRAVAEFGAKDRRIAALEDQLRSTRVQSDERDRASHDVIGNYSTQIQVLSERIVELEQQQQHMTPSSSRSFH
eukprot:PhM_4_TR820/c0_g1_i1/m.4798